MQHIEVQSGSTGSDDMTAGVRMEDAAERHRADEAVALAQRWIDESAEADVDPAAQRLADILIADARGTA